MYAQHSQTYSPESVPVPRPEEIKNVVSVFLKHNAELATCFAQPTKRKKILRNFTFSNIDWKQKKQSNLILEQKCISPKPKENFPD